MVRIDFVFRDIFRHSGSTVIKLISLTLGLVVALLIFAFNAHELSYDNYHKDGERIYRIGVKAIVDNDVQEGYKVNGALSGVLKEEIPEVELASCVLECGQQGYVVNKNNFRAETICADSGFFHIFTYRILEGDSPNQLNVADNVFVSEKFAKKVWGKQSPIGEKIEDEDGRSLTVAGVFENVPENTHLRFDMVRALVREAGATWNDGGNYVGYVKLNDVSGASSVNGKLPMIIQKYLPEHTKELTYYLQPVRDIYLKYSFGSLSNIMLLSLLGFIVLLACSLNYVLITISSLATKAKLIGVHKVNGASGWDIFKLFLFETVVHIILALIFTVILLGLLKGQIEGVTYVSLATLFASGNLWAVVMVLIVLLLVAGVVPGRVFASVTVMQVLRKANNNRRRWKKMLLYTQILTSCFLLTLILIFSKQYDYLMNKDLGYDYEALYYTEIINTADNQAIFKVKNELKRLPFISGIAASTNVPLYYFAGMKVEDRDRKNELFTSRVLAVDEDYFDVMNIKMEGDASLASVLKDNHQVVVNQKFVDRIDSAEPLGVAFCSDSACYTISGVCHNFQIATLHVPQLPVFIKRLEYNTDGRLCLTFKMNLVNQENLAMLKTAIKSIIGERDVQIWSFQEQFRWDYNYIRILRDTIVLISLLAVLITVLGLTGFVGDEVVRRKKEIALRKVNGASERIIVWLFCRQIGILGLYAVPVGLVGAYYVGSLWQMEFAAKSPLEPGIFVTSIFLTFFLIYMTVIFKSIRAAMANPVQALKSE